MSKSIAFSGTQKAKFKQAQQWRIGGVVKDILIIITQIAHDTVSMLKQLLKDVMCQLILGKGLRGLRK